ncbi:MAG: PAS domain S-box protein [Candidatus Methanoperedens sp.]
MSRKKNIKIARDISERKREETDQKESCELYRELFDNASDCIYTIDLKGNFLTVNNSVVKAMMCDSEQEVLESNIYKWMTPESQEKALKFMQEVINEDDYYNKSVVIEIIRKDGEHDWLEHKLRPIKDKNNNIIGLHGIGRNITEKIRLEEKIKASEALYKDLFENANDFIYTHDLKGNIQSINKIGLELLDVTEEEILGTNVLTWVTPESAKKIEDRFRKIYLNQPLEPSIIIEAINKKGEHQWAEARTRLLKDGNKIIGIHGIMRDITEKMKLEKELKENNEKLERSYYELKVSEAKYRDLFENAQDAMYVLDTKSNILKMNRIGLEILGGSPEEVIGSNIFKWITPDSQKIINERQKKRLSGDKVSNTDLLEVVCKNGEHRWAEIRTREIKNGDRTIEIHGIARDVTENRLLKQELRKSNKQQKLLCYLIQGTRGGKTRALILKHLSDRSYNANQLSTALNMDYKTIRHHLNVLIKNGIIAKGNDGYSDLYYLSNNINLNLNEIESKI